MHFHGLGVAGAGGPGIIGNAKNSMQFHCLGGGVEGAGGGKVPEIKASVPKLSAQAPAQPFSQPP